MTLKLIVGNKNYSSWSLRPWIAMKAAGIPFEEQVISLDAPDFKAVVGAVSGPGPVAGRARGASAGARRRQRNARRFPAAAQADADEPGAGGNQARADAG